MTTVININRVLSMCLWLLLFDCLISYGQESSTGHIADSIIVRQVQLGYEALERGDYRQACELFRLVLDIDWNNPQAYQWWTSAQERLAKRIHDLLKAGDRCLTQGLYAEALVNYREALRYDSTRAETKQRVWRAERKIHADRLVLAALPLFLAGDYGRLNTVIDSALSDDPGHPAALALREKSQGAGYASTPQSHLRGDTAMWELHLAALKMYRDGQYHAAIKQWEMILEKYPGDADVLANIEQARLRLQPERDH